MTPRKDCPKEIFVVYRIILWISIFIPPDKKEKNVGTPYKAKYSPRKRTRSRTSSHWWRRCFLYAKAVRPFRSRWRYCSYGVLRRVSSFIQHGWNGFSYKDLAPSNMSRQADEQKLQIWRACLLHSSAVFGSSECRLVSISVRKWHVPMSAFLPQHAKDRLFAY